MSAEQAALYHLAREVMRTPVISYSPREIAEIQASFDLSDADFGGIFGVSADAVAAWKRPEGTKAHRYPSPPACKLLYWCALAARESPSARNNRLRLAARHGKNWRRRLLCGTKFP